MAGEYTSCKLALFTPSLHPPKLLLHDAYLPSKQSNESLREDNLWNLIKTFETSFNHKFVLSVGSNERPTTFSIFNT